MAIKEFKNSFSLTDIGALQDISRLKVNLLIFLLWQPKFTVNNVLLLEYMY